MLVFSIRPQFVQAIFDGRKRYEYRTRRPDVRPGDRILIYETRPTSAVVGSACVTEIIDAAPADVWTRTHEGSGVGEQAFAAYFNARIRAVAIGLTDVRRFDQEVKLPNGMTAPQAWAKWPAGVLMPAH